MANRSWFAFFVRFGLLVGVLAALGVALVWQRQMLHVQAMQAQKRVVGQEVALEQSLLDQLSQERLTKARSKATEIAAQRRAIRKKSFAPDLSVPVIKAATTRRKYQEEFTQYRLQSLDAYRRLTKDPAAAKAAGEQFLESFLRQTSKMDFSEIDYEKLDQLGLAAVEAGGDDPLLRMYQLYAHWSLTEESAWKAEDWKKTAARLKEAGYPRRDVADLFRFQLRIAPERLTKQRDDQFRETATAIAQWLEEEGDDPQWRRCVCGRLWSFWSDHDGEIHRQLVIECLKSNKIAEYPMHLMLGAFHLRQGWDHRGTTYASQVSAAQWAGFQKQTAIATDHLQYAWSLHPELPYAPHSLISAALAKPDADASAHFWFLRTLESQFDYYDAYVSMLNTLLSRWGGSKDKMLSFARNCLGTDQFSTTVPYFVVDVLWKLQSMEGMELRQSPPVIALLRELVEKRNAFRTRSPDAVLYEDDGAYHADLILLLDECGLTDLAAQEVAIAGDKVFWNRLQTGARPGRYLAQRLLAISGLDKNRVLEFDRLLRQPWSADTSETDLEQLTEEYQELSQSPGARKAEKFYLHAGTIIEQLRLFSAGEWVDLPFGESMYGWEPACYGWSVNADGSIDLNSSGTMGLRPLANFHPPLEVEATLDLTAPREQMIPTGIAWFHEGQPQTGKPTSVLLGFESSSALSRNDPSAVRDMAVEQGLQVSARFKHLDSSGPHRLKVKLWERFVEFSIDDKNGLASQSQLPLDEDGFLYFGTALQVAGPLRWSGIRVRKLNDTEPPGESNAYLDRQLYWPRRQAASPDDPLVAAPMCRLLYEQGRFDELLALVNRQQELNPEVSNLAFWKARALLEQHDEAGAIRELKALTDSGKATPDAYALLGELYAIAHDSQLRDNEKGMMQLSQALAISKRRHAGTLAATAAAYAAGGNFPSAIKFQLEALDLANEPQEAEWLLRLAEYEAGRPCYRP